MEAGKVEYRKGESPVEKEPEVKSKIVGEYYVTGAEAFRAAAEHFRLPTVTICVLMLENGFPAIGHSNFLFPQEFDADLGRMLARRRALSKVRELEASVQLHKLDDLSQFAPMGVLEE